MFVGAPRSYRALRASAMEHQIEAWLLQAMDRAHRIGQDKPVLVLRLAAANSVDGRMLKRANSKLMLERLVIRKGAFMASEADTKASSLSNDELMELLKDTIPLKDEPQSDVVSDKVRHPTARGCLLVRLMCTAILGVCLLLAWYSSHLLLLLVGRVLFPGRCTVMGDICEWWSA